MQAEEKTVIIRREIQAPEIDEYDEVPYKNIQVPAGEVNLGLLLAIL